MKSQAKQITGLTSLYALAVASLISYSPLEARAQQHLPIAPETRRVLEASKTEALQRSYCEALIHARQAFNGAINDGRFSLDEQRSVLAAYSKVQELDAKLAKRGFTTFAMQPEADSDAYNLTDENLTRALQIAQTTKDYSMLTSLFGLEGIGSVVTLETPENVREPQVPLQYNPGEEFSSREERHRVLTEELRATRDGFPKSRMSFLREDTRTISGAAAVIALGVVSILAIRRFYLNLYSPRRCY
jgi:hypothetical protein